MLAAAIGGCTYLMLKRHAWRRLHGHKDNNDSSGEQK